MLLPRFQLDEPETVEGACALLGEHADGATVYAGGTELLLAMKQRVLRYDRLVNIKRIPGLAAIARAGERLVIGALATHHDLERSAVVQEAIPALAVLARHVANVRVRMAGTLGGNLCFAEPHADPPTLLGALGATLTLAGPHGAREVEAEAFFTGAYETARRGDEILTRVSVPVPGPEAAVAYRRLAFIERPTAAVAVLLRRSRDGAVGHVRIVVGAVGPRPERARSAELALTGLTAGEAAAELPRAARLAAEAVAIMPDLHGSEDYKRHLVEVQVRRAVQDALGAVPPARAS